MKKPQERMSAQGRKVTWIWAEQLLRRDTSSQATAKRTVRITCMVRLSLLSGNELWIVCYETFSSRHRTKEFNTLVEEPGKDGGRMTAAGEWEKRTDISAYQ